MKGKSVQSEFLPRVRTVEAYGETLDEILRRARAKEIFIPSMSRTKKNGVWTVTFRENEKHADN